MAAQTITGDIEQVDRWLSSADAGYAELHDDLPFLRSSEHARTYLTGLREGLLAAQSGDVVGHDQIRRDVQARRNRHRPHAAE